jgi:hypothetical protein
MRNTATLRLLAPLGHAAAILEKLTPAAHHCQKGGMVLREHGRADALDGLVKRLDR